MLRQLDVLYTNTSCPTVLGRFVARIVVGSEWGTDRRSIVHLLVCCGVAVVGEALLLFRMLFGG